MSGDDYDARGASSVSVVTHGLALARSPSGKPTWAGSKVGKQRAGSHTHVDNFGAVAEEVGAKGGAFWGFTSEKMSGVGSIGETECAHRRFVGFVMWFCWLCVWVS